MCWAPGRKHMHVQMASVRSFFVLAEGKPGICVCVGGGGNAYVWMKYLGTRNTREPAQLWAEVAREVKVPSPRERQPCGCRELGRID
jgi:hypothetical protein